MKSPRLLTLAGLVLLLLAALPVAAAPPQQTSLNDTWIAFSSQAEGEAGIWVVHPDGSDLHRLTEGRDIYPAWSPDGTMLAYVREIHAGDPAAGYQDVSTYTSEIRIVDTAGNLLWTVWRDGWAAGEGPGPRTGNCGAPQWSSDGQAISFPVDMQFFFIFAWAGRRTFYLGPTPRLEAGRGPEGSLSTGGSVLLDQSWAPGPVPTWVRVGLDLGSCQLMAYDQPLVRTIDAVIFNPRWSPSGQSLTYYEQTSTGSSFRNALVQAAANGQVERTLLESSDLVLYDIAEWSPDGQRLLIGTSADWTSWLWMLFLQAMGQSPAPGAELQPPSVLPATPPAEGYLYVLDAAGGKVPVAAPAPNTVDLISRQPWSPDGRQVVFMRAPYPVSERTRSDALGIYAGPPGQARRIVRFLDGGENPLPLTVAYPVWQPVPQGPLPTMVPLGTLGMGPVGGGSTPTAAPTPEPTAPPSPTPTPTAAPTQASPTAVPPSSTPQNTVPPVAPAAPLSKLQTYLLIGAGVLALALLVAIVLVLRHPPGPAEETKAARPFLLRGPRRTPEATAGGPAARRSGLFGRRRPAAPAESAAETPAADSGVQPPPGMEPIAWPAADRCEAPPPEEALPAEKLAPPAEAPSWESQAAPAPGAEPVPSAAVPPPPPPPVREIDPLLQQGIAQVKAGDAAGGFVTLRQVLARSPEEPDAWLWLGWAAASQKQYDVAEKCFLRAQWLGRSEQAAKALAWLQRQS